MKISENSYNKLIDSLELMAIGAALWYRTADSTGYDFPNFYSETYKGRIELFFIVLRRLIYDGHLRLAKNGEFLKGSIDDQIALFKDAFPKEERMKEVDTYWWFTDECPAGAVWIIDREIENFTTPAENNKYYYWA